MKKTILFFALYLNAFFIFAQMKNFPPELFLGQKVEMLKDFLSFRNGYSDSLHPGRIKEPLFVYVYNNNNFKSLVSDNDIIKISMLADSIGTVKLIQVFFKTDDKKYFNFLRQYLPAGADNMEVYGMNPEEGVEQTFESLIRYKTFFISMALNGRGELYLMNTYDSTDTVFLTIGYNSFIGIKKL